ncbi:hypothetical protein NMY22_g7978 [Coprinellus aureogranulatus]|nr:hypothetical protein NMY22_g7978 [Coprinellus aureogranulatus]
MDPVDPRRRTKANTSDTRLPASGFLMLHRSNEPTPRPAWGVEVFHLLPLRHALAPALSAAHLLLLSLLKPSLHIKLSLSESPSLHSPLISTILPSPTRILPPEIEDIDGGGNAMPETVQK